MKLSADLLVSLNRFATSRLKALVDDHFNTFTAPEQNGLREYRPHEEAFMQLHTLRARV